MKRHSNSWIFPGDEDTHRSRRSSKNLSQDSLLNDGKKSISREPKENKCVSKVGCSYTRQRQPADRSFRNSRWRDRV